MVIFQWGNYWIKDTDRDRFWNWTRLEEITPTTRRYLKHFRIAFSDLYDCLPRLTYAYLSDETPGTVISGIKNYKSRWRVLIDK